MADELAVSGDKNCSPDTYNGETDGQILCKHVENSVDVCEDELPPEPNGNCLEITFQNNINDDDDDVDNGGSMEMKRLKSSLKRRPHVVPKPVLIKYRSNKESCNGSDHLTIDNDSASAKNSGENLSPTCLRSKEGRTSRYTRNSAGASGGIFNDDFPTDFSEFQGEADENIHGSWFCFLIYCCGMSYCLVVFVVDNGI